MGRERLEIGLFVALLLAVSLIGLLGCTPTHETKPRFYRVWDRPVLETVSQVWQAESTGYSSFRIGDEYFVVNNLPHGYIEYSREWSRMM